MFNAKKDVTNLNLSLLVGQGIVRWKDVGLAVKEGRFIGA
jgi:hypothetical protein